MMMLSVAGRQLELTGGKKMEEKTKPELGKGIFHPSARPMKVYVDDDGIMYLCDEDIDPERPLKEQACWTCDKVQFMRGG